MKRIMIPIFTLIFILIRCSPTADSISTNAEQIGTEITRGWIPASSTLQVESGVNTSIDISAKIIAETQDPREYRINLYSEIHYPSERSGNIYSIVSPDEIIGSGSNSYNFHITVFVDNLTESNQYLVGVGGEWVFTVGTPVPEVIPEVGSMLVTNVSGDELDLPDSDNNTSISETPGMEVNLASMTIGFIAALSYFHKRKINS